MKRIILASNSPRRQELLRGLDLEFTVDTRNDFEESLEPGVPAHLVPVHMSEGKSHGFHRPLEADEVLITADTVVIVPSVHEEGRDAVVLGKPHSREEAVEMLRLLSGRTHEVVTAVTIRSAERELTFSDSTSVTFASLEDGEIDYYIDHYKPFDKAGAYGIQEWIGLAAIERIEGSYFNVVGFPVQRVWAELKHFI